MNGVLGPPLSGETAAAIGSGRVVEAKRLVIRRPMEDVKWARPCVRRIDPPTSVITRQADAAALPNRCPRIATSRHSAVCATHYSHRISCTARLLFEDQALDMIETHNPVRGTHNRLAALWFRLRGN